MPSQDARLSVKTADIAPSYITDMLQLSVSTLDRQVTLRSVDNDLFIFSVSVRAHEFQISKKEFHQK